MQDSLNQFFLSFKMSPTLAWWCAFAVLIVGIAVVSWMVNFILKHYIVGLAHRLAQHVHNHWVGALVKHRIFHRLSHLGPALVIYEAIPLITNAKYAWTQGLATGVQQLAVVYMLLAVMWFVTALINAFHDFYQTLTVAASHPIRGYLQVIKIILWFIVAVLAISVLLNKSPWAFFTGLGALSAVSLLVFKDTILGFVASIQVSVYDMVRVGDWITMPKYHLDGDVLEVSINNVKVQNFDKTIVTVPTYALVSSGVQNWRGMSESGGRRIKRSIFIDLDTIKFCDQEMLDHLSKLHFLKNHLPKRLAEIKAYNQEHGFDEVLPVNGRSLTNIGLFRAYVENYLRHNDKIHKKMTFLIRHLQPTETGLPLELYVFTNDNDWVRYEGIQSDIFDHLLASLPLFGLQAFQVLSSQGSRR